MSRTRYFGAALILAAAVSLILSFGLGPRLAGTAVTAADRLHMMGAAGYIVFIAGEFAVTLVGIVPGALLGLAAGAVYGIAAGFGVSAFGIMAGAVVAFALSRSLLRPWIGRALARGGRMAALDGLIARDGWRLVALMRISPIMPFSITSYALGLSGISLRNYLLGSLASLPPLLGYVAVGALAGQGVRERTQDSAGIHLMLFALGAAATLALTVHVSRLLGKALTAA